VGLYGAHAQSEKPNYKKY